MKFNSGLAFGFFCLVDRVQEPEGNKHLVEYIACRIPTWRPSGPKSGDIMGLCKICKHLLFPLALGPSEQKF